MGDCTLVLGYCVTNFTAVDAQLEDTGVEIANCSFLKNAS